MGPENDLSRTLSINKKVECHSQGYGHILESGKELSRLSCRSNKVTSSCSLSAKFSAHKISSGIEIIDFIFSITYGSIKASIQILKSQSRNISPISQDVL